MHTDACFAGQNAYCYIPLYNSVGAFYTDTGSNIILANFTSSLQAPCKAPDHTVKSIYFAINFIVFLIEN